jgi:hypothetical protein
MPAQIGFDFKSIFALPKKAGPHPADWSSSRLAILQGKCRTIKPRAIQE